MPQQIIEERWTKIISPTRRLVVTKLPRPLLGSIWRVTYQTRPNEKSDLWTAKDSILLSKLGEKTALLGTYQGWFEYIPKFEHHLKYLFHEIVDVTPPPVNPTMADRLKKALQ